MSANIGVKPQAGKSAKPAAPAQPSGVTPAAVVPDQPTEPGGETPVTTESVVQMLQKEFAAPSGADPGQEPSPEPAPPAEEAPPAEVTDPDLTPPEEPREAAEPGDEAEPPKGQWPDAAIERVRKYKEQRNAAREEAAAATAERETLEARLSEMEQQAEQLRANPPAPEPQENQTQQELSVVNGLLEGLEDLRTGTMDEAAAEQFKRTVAPFGLFNAEGGFVYDKLRQFRELCRTKIQRCQEQLQQQRERQNANAQVAKAFEPVIANKFPWVKDMKSKEYVEWQRLQRDFPEALRHPSGKAVLAIVAQHWPAFKAELLAATQPNGNGHPNGASPAPNGKPKPLVKVAPRVPSVPSVVPSMRGAGEAQFQQVRERAMKPDATPEDMAAYTKLVLARG